MTSTSSASPATEHENTRWPPSRRPEKSATKGLGWGASRHGLASSKPSIFQRSRRRLCRDSEGSTLAELLVYIGILAAFVGSFSVASFQAFGTRSDVADDGLAINELRRGLGWFADDVGMAREATVVADTLTLEWTDYFEDLGAEHMVTYTIVEDRLVRSHSVDGGPAVVQAAARNVVSADFVIGARSVSAELTVDAEAGSTRTLSMKALMKPENP
jgi:hypothetical protein